MEARFHDFDSILAVLMGETVGLALFVTASRDKTPKLVIGAADVVP